MVLREPGIRTRSASSVEPVTSVDPDSRQEPEYFRTRFRFDIRREAVWRQICRYLQKRYVPRASRILEIGAGYCHFINNIAGVEKHAVDISPTVLGHAAPDVIAHVGSCTQLSQLGDSRFDIVFASNLLEHLSSQEADLTLSEVRRVLRPGGRFIVLQPNFRYCYRQYFDDYTHIRVFTHHALSDLLAASGFEVREVRPRFLPFSMNSRLPRASWLVGLYLVSPFKPAAGQMLVVAMRP